MKRFALLLRNEFKLFKTAPAVHLIAILQPTIMYLLMSTIMVVPTFKMFFLQPSSFLGQRLLAAAETIGSPIGPDYIEPALQEWPVVGSRQLIEVVDHDGQPTALQSYGYIDSNLVKNFRNRLTSALLVMWNADLGNKAVLIDQHPWLPADIPYTVYFGMAMIPLAAYLAAAMIGGFLIAQEYEQDTIPLYRLSPIPFPVHLAAKLTRSLISGLAAAAILYIAVGTVTGVWASSFLAVLAIITPLTLFAACLGLIAGMLTGSTLPSFLIALASAFLFWLIGSGFGLAAGFSQVFEKISRLIPNTAVIEMLFPYYYFGRQVAAHPLGAKLQLAGYLLAILLGTIVIYRQQMTRSQR